MSGSTGRAAHPFAQYASRLQDLRTAAGHPSYATIAREIGQLRRSRGVPAEEARVSRVTVYDCFRHDRKRVDTDLVLEIVTVLTGDPSATAEWAAGLQEFQRRNEAAALVRVTTSLPAPMDVFVGRETELSALARNPATWISGLPGTGKSQLSYAAARRLIDTGRVAGVLFADLRGFSPEGPPADPGAVVSAMLRLLGTQPHAVSEAQRTATLASEITARNMLLILDDAASADQVNQVMPDLTGVRALVTSRFAPDPADVAPAHLRLSPFSRSESVAVLRAVAGSRATAEPALLDSLLQTTGDLPLAVHLTASRVAALPNWTMAEHAQVAAARHEELRLHDALQATFDLTYSSLPEPAQRLLRLIAVHPEALLDEASIASLAGGEIEDVPAAVADLVRANLLTQPRAGTFQIHELPRIHAADVSTEVDPPSWRQAASDRFLGDLVDRAWSAQRVLKEAVGEVPYAPRSLPGSQPTAPILTEEEARAFFDSAADLLLSLAMKRSPQQSHDGAVLYAASEAMMTYLHQKGRYGDAQIIHQEALRHATEVGDELGRARALAHWGSTLVQIGLNERARKVLQAALEATQSLPVERLMVHNSLGVVHASTGADSLAEENYRRALALAEELGDLRRSGFAWSNLAHLSMRNGDTSASRAALERAIEFATLTQDASSLARDHINLASLLVDSGDLDGAYAAALTGHERSRQIGMAAGEVVAAVNIAAVLAHRERFDAALEWVEPALAAATELGMVQHQVTLHGTLSACLRHLGDEVAAAVAAFDAVIGSIDVGDPALSEESVAHLAECVEAVPDLTDHPRWGEVRDLVSGMGTAAARSVQSLLFARTADPSS